MATVFVNRTVTRRLGPVGLPGLALDNGVPAGLRTLVVVPTLLTSEADLRAHIESLEVHHLAGAGGDLSFALLSDGLDSDTEVAPTDSHLIDVAQAAIAALNLRHGPAPGGKRFYLLHRHRRFNPGENCWMGWERKRGKLHELNRLLRGATDTSFMALDDSARPDILTGVRYVITLDADTRLPRDAALRLIGKMAHPLNQPAFSEAEQRVVGGYAILQPRVTPALPMGLEGSLYQRLTSGPGGMDPYAAAVSDVSRIFSAKVLTPARASTTWMLLRQRLRGVFLKIRCSAMICSKECLHALASRRTWRWSKTFPRATTWPCNASIVGHAATGSCCPGCWGAATTVLPFPRWAAGRCWTTCAVHSWHRPTCSC